MRSLFVSLFTFLSLCLLGQTRFDLNLGVEAAYRTACQLKFEAAQAQIDSIKVNDPDNVIIYHIENYIDFFTLFISEDEVLFKELKKNKKARLEQLNNGPKDSPYYLFCKAEVNLQWATIRLKFEDNYDAALEFYRAYKLLEKNKKAFPEFIENYKSLSIIHALAESLPGWFRTISGIKGSIVLGTEEIAKLHKHTQQNPELLWKEEVYAIYAYILFYLNNEREQAYELLNETELSTRNNPLLRFLKANISQKTGRTDEAISILENREEGPEYFPFLYLDFMYGKFKLYQLDEDADEHILKFINNFEGKHFIKEAYQKLAWYHLVINEDLVKYKQYMKLCQTKGNRLVDEDKQALEEAESQKIPNSDLLKARLLFDGGYFANCYSFLIRKAYLFQQKDLNRLEFQYRMGRTTHELKNYPEAVNYYMLTLLDGEEDESYLACNAALQTAFILEEQGRYSDAKKFFNRCLSINPKKYKTSMHQKAESGLNRLKNQE